MNTPDEIPVCPISPEEYPRILLAHGGGGRLMHALIHDLIAAAFKSSALNTDLDSATVDMDSGTAAFTTDSFVVDPPFFPGGDIGRLAVFGTVNDLAMSGALPQYLSIGFILEEGLALEEFWKICLSIGRAAREAGVQIVTGDTKVVERGKCDRIFINTSGIGKMQGNCIITPSQIRPGDKIIVNGDLGRHGMAVMSVREGLRFESRIESDCAELSSCIQGLLDDGIDIHCLRDLTRGGLASALVELSESSGLAFSLEEESIPVCREVKSACNILGIDPVYVANEGRFAAFVKPEDVNTAINLINSANPDFHATVIGEVVQAPQSRVFIKNRYGTERILDMLSGEQFPRIC